MNVVRTVVTTVSKSRSIQSQSEDCIETQEKTDESIIAFSESMKAVFSLEEIRDESRLGDQELDMLMLDG